MALVGAPRSYRSSAHQEPAWLATWIHSRAAARAWLGSGGRETCPSLVPLRSTAAPGTPRATTSTGRRG